MKRHEGQLHEPAVLIAVYGPGETRTRTRRYAARYARPHSEGNSGRSRPT